MHIHFCKSKYETRTAQELCEAADVHKVILADMHRIAKEKLPRNAKVVAVFILHTN